MLKFATKQTEKMNSTSVENFLKNIFTLKNDEGEKASMTNLSMRLGISGPAITDMAKKLSAKGLVNYEPYKELELTPQGLNFAIKVIRRHRIWEMFLHQVLKMDLDEVHMEADMLEHQTSDRLLAKMDDYLGKPKFDPHGDPIPGTDGSIQRHKNAIKMNECEEGEQYKIVRLIYADEEVQQMFKHYKVETGKSFKVVKMFALDNSMEIEFDGRKVHLSPVLQKKIYCKYLDA
ncbi:metal-dependent transcriptional regulator [Saccharicrinis sp. 156]|uniref:metal-dependent transcriptional regulator n=2 Tax=unclassified Saccharicrinis TaxID=2646859 RepID=UPI003D33BA89